MWKPILDVPLLVPPAGLLPGPIIRSINHLCMQVGYLALAFVLIGVILSFFLKAEDSQAYNEALEKRMHDPLRSWLEIFKTLNKAIQDTDLDKPPNSNKK